MRRAVRGVLGRVSEPHAALGAVGKPVLDEIGGGHETNDAEQWSKARGDQGNRSGRGSAGSEALFPGGLFVFRAERHRWPPSLKVTAEVWFSQTNTFVLLEIPGFSSRCMLDRMTTARSGRVCSSWV